MSKDAICEICGIKGTRSKNMCHRCYQAAYVNRNHRRRIDTIIDHTHDRHWMGYSTCKIIKKHHEEMKDHPERLTTDFIQKMINVNCDDKEKWKYERNKNKKSKIGSD